MSLDPDRLEHLKLVQGVITRLAGNGFALKLAAVTATTTILSVAGATRSSRPVDAGTTCSCSSI